MVIYYLTCKDQDEATKIGRALLEDKLIACARQSDVRSPYWWNGKINDETEVLLTMESLEEKFDDIAKIVTELHSYEEFVLTAVSVLKTNPGVETWLDETLR